MTNYFLGVASALLFCGLLRWLEYRSDCRKAKAFQELLDRAVPPSSPECPNSKH